MFVFLVEIIDVSLRRQERLGLDCSVQDPTISGGNLQENE